MSSALPTSGTNVPDLGLLGCLADLKDSNSSSVQPAFEHGPIVENCVSNDKKPAARVENDQCLESNRNGELSARTCKTSIFHRVAEVRKSQGLTERTVAKRMGVDVRTYRAMETPTTDLTLSELNAVQRALEVPLVDLLVDSQSLSRPVEERAKLVRTMKTAIAIRETKASSKIARLSQMLCEQLIELMPELKEVGGWPQFGARRGQSAVGRVLSNPIDTSDLHLD